SSRAQALNLTQTFNYSFPTTSPGNAGNYIQQNWYQASSTNYGKNDLTFEADPFNTSDTTPLVLKVLYAQGSYTPSGSKTSAMGGAEFYSQPAGNNYDSALVRYDLAFDPTFQWVQGGKLPGLYGGDPSSGCSGGNQASGTNCFSMRLMWRAGGQGEAYGYIPSTNQGLCGSGGVQCNDQYGTSFSRGMINFKTGQWTTIEVYTKINDASSKNGILQVWQDGNLVISHNDLQYRTTNAIAASSFFFSTFFGGSDASWASPVNTYTYFKNIQFSVGHPVELNDSAGSLLAPSGHWWAVAIILAFAHLFF
ncbi:hypothetical protein BC940DRAFT_309814, partial [Gongronella butleri]